MLYIFHQHYLKTTGTETVINWFTDYIIINF